MKYEKVRELAMQAGCETDMFGIGHWDDQKLHNFTQLILQECLKTVMEQKSLVEGMRVYSVSDQDWNAARIQHSQHIHDKIVEIFS